MNNFEYETNRSRTKSKLRPQTSHFRTVKSNKLNLKERESIGFSNRNLNNSSNQQFLIDQTTTNISIEESHISPFRKREKKLNLIN